MPRGRFLDWIRFIGILISSQSFCTGLQRVGSFSADVTGWAECGGWVEFVGSNEPATTNCGARGVNGLKINDHSNRN